MIADDDDKTPHVVTLAIESAKTPRPLFAVPRRPPTGRPTGALSVSEMIEQITKEVRASVTADLERRHGLLRVELGAEIRTATSLGIAAILMNALAIVASLAFSRLLPLSGVGLALVALVAVFFGAVKLGALRAPSQ